MIQPLSLLVTGATGFIGRRLVSHLCARGETVHVLGRRPCNIDGVQDILVSRFEPDIIRAALANQSFDAVMHLAAAGIKPDERDAGTLMQINSLLPGVMVEIAARCGARAVIVTGSSSEYKAPRAGQALTEDAPLCDDKLYGASKAAGALLALAQGASLALPVAVLRLFNVYGPGEAAHRLLPSLVQRLLRGEPVPLSIGNQQRDFLHVDDACGAMLAALDAMLARTMAGGAYNVATGQANSVADFARAVGSALHADSALLQFGALSLRADDLPFVVGDPQRLEAACGWRSRLTMAAGIQAAVAEYQSTPISVNR
jgi:nucleoside-diphosphate-sugar epimerase